MRFAALLALMLFAHPGLAAELMSASKALEETRAGRMVLIDVRTPREWRQTGVGSVATPVSMHDRAFLSNLQTVIRDNPGKTLGFICATGKRTAWLVSELEKRGYSGIVDVSEGMMGNGRGPGWIATGLPVRQP